MPPKPKRPQPQIPIAVQERDCLQTPNYAVDLLVPFLPSPAFNRLDTPIWDPCCGPGKIMNRLAHHRFSVFGTDISMGQTYNALTHCPDRPWRVAVTNPPFSLKHKIVKRFIELGNPFAFLVPGDWSGWMVEAVIKYGCRLIVPERRISYITPNALTVIFQKNTLANARKGERVKFKKFSDLTPRLIKKYAGLRYQRLEDVPGPVMAKYSQAQFHSVWLTRYLYVPEVITVVPLSVKDKENI